MLGKLNRARRRHRWPIKCAILGLTWFLVCFPYPRLFLRHVAHWRNPNALIDTKAPALQPLAADLRSLIHDGDDPQRVLKAVEGYVCQRIPYAFDWETWGVADYLPTLDEVLEMGREDCDGQAVVAANLLQSIGYRAELVTDFTHVWVKTDYGELLGPRPSKAVVATDKGLRVNWGWRLVANFSDAMGYGVAVFPAERQVIFLLAVWVAGLLLFAGLKLMREGGHDSHAVLRWLQLIGFAILVAGVTTLVWSGRSKARSPASSTLAAAPVRRVRGRTEDQRSLSE